MDRLPQPAAMSAEAAERLSDRAGEFTDAELDAAAANICDDYLTCGRSYPDRNWGSRITAGDYLMATFDEDELANKLTAMIYGRQTDQQEARFRLERNCEEGMKAWLLDKHEDLVRDRAEELAEELAEDE
jgi:hypothetical protein